MNIKFNVCGLGYDKNYCVTDFNHNYGSFDMCEDAEILFNSLVSHPALCFYNIYAENVYRILLRIEKCEEDGNRSECIEVEDECFVSLE